MGSHTNILSAGEHSTHSDRRHEADALDIYYGLYRVVSKRDKAEWHVFVSAVLSARALSL